MRHDELVVGPPTPGILRLTAFEDDERWVGYSRAEPGGLSGWHHHGAYDTGTVHREGTEGDVALEAVVVRIGSGPQVFEAPDPVG